MAFNSVSAARHKARSFARCGNTDVLRREGETLRKPGITHKFLEVNFLRTLSRKLDGSFESYDTSFIHISFFAPALSPDPPKNLPLVISTNCLFQLFFVIVCCLTLITGIPL